MKLARGIRADLKAAAEASWERVKRTHDAGIKLREAKAKVGHGTWAEWLDKHCALSPRQAQKYMKFANAPLEAHLPDAEARWQRISGRHKDKNPSKDNGPAQDPGGRRGRKPSEADTTGDDEELHVVIRRVERLAFVEQAKRVRDRFGIGRGGDWFTVTVRRAIDELDPQKGAGGPHGAHAQAGESEEAGHEA
jgi:hypothetical protein